MRCLPGEGISAYKPTVLKNHFIAFASIYFYAVAGALL